MITKCNNQVKKYVLKLSYKSLCRIYFAQSLRNSASRSGIKMEYFELVCHITAFGWALKFTFTLTYSHWHWLITCVWLTVPTTYWNQPKVSKATQRAAWDGVKSDKSDVLSHLQQGGLQGYGSQGAYNIEMNKYNILTFLIYRGWGKVRYLIRLYYCRFEILAHGKPVISFNLSKQENSKLHYFMQFLA